MARCSLVYFKSTDHIHMMKSYQGKWPDIASSAWVAQSSEVIGKVQIEADASVWFHTVIRGDSETIAIGKKSNIQDGCILHTDLHHQLIIKDFVTVGHGCILHGCTIESECLIGMGAILLNGVRIGKHSIIGAGAVVMEHSVIPERSLVVGCPAKIIKQVSDSQIQEIIENAEHYVALSKEYQQEDTSWTITQAKS